MILKGFLVALRFMVLDIKSVMKANQEMPINDRYDEEYFISKLDNIIDNLDNKMKEW